MTLAKLEEVEKSFIRLKHRVGRNTDAGQIIHDEFVARRRPIERAIEHLHSAPVHHVRERPPHTEIGEVGAKALEHLERWVEGKHKSLRSLA